MALKHIEHIEDLLLEKSSDSAAFFVLKKSIDFLKTSSTIHVKYDGAPSLICGKIDGKFFLSTKSIFNKDPKVAYKVEDIKTLFNKEIVHKMKCVFNALKDEDFPNIIQFDLLGVKSEYAKQSLVQHLTPNVVRYCFNGNIKRFDIVIAVHSIYDSKTILELKEEIPKQIQNDFRFKKAYTVPIKSKLKSNIELLNVVQEKINKFENELNETVLKEFKCFINHSIRKLYFYEYEDISEVIDKFSSFVFEKYKNQIQSYKTDKTRKVKMLELADLILDILNPETEKTLEQVLDITKDLNAIKDNIISNLYTANVTPCIGSFTMHEGAVICIEDEDTTLVKLVNRYKFSAENFLKNDKGFNDAQSGTA